MDKRLIAITILAFVIASSSVSALASFSYTGSSARYVSTQNYPTLNGMYSSSDLNTYWPIVGDNSVCRGRQDVLLQVAPAGCQPLVARSDLLAEQNVPVLCQLQAFQVNPLLDINAIDSITFSGRYPSAVSTVGYYPARAALSSSGKLSNNALINNAGYVVVVLKRQQNETALPESVTLNLTARLRYDAYNALGVGSAYFILGEQTEEEFKNAAYKNSFWQGRYYIKADSIDAEHATISLYYGDRKITTTTVKRGQQSGEIYVPGFSTCQAALKVAYDGFDSSASNRARIEVQEGNKKTDVFDVYNGMSFANGKCRVTGKIAANADGTGSVSVSCSGDKSTLSITPKSGSSAIANSDSKDDENVKAYLEYARSAIGEYKAVSLNYVSDTDSTSGKAYGEIALQSGLNMIRDSPYKARLSSEYSELVKIYAENYPSAQELAYYQSLESSMFNVDSQNSAAVFRMDNQYITVRAVKFTPASKTNKITLNIGGRTVEYEQGKDTASVQGTSISFTSQGSDGKSLSHTMSVVKITPYEVTLSPTKCGGTVESRSNSVLEEGESDTICGVSVRVEDIDAEKLAIVRIVPKVDNAQTETNLSVSVGIEKRAIKLSTEKASELVTNLNESIQKFESISNAVSNTAKGLKAACFSTAAALMVKNFYTGIGGEGGARKEVMRGDNGWTVKCSQAFKDKTLIGAYGMKGDEYVSVDDCLRQNSALIENDVEIAENALEMRNINVKAATNKTETSNMGTEVKLDQSIQAYADKLSASYSSDANIGEIVKDPAALAKSATYTQMQQLEYNALLLKDSSLSPVQRAAAEDAIKNIQNSVGKEIKIAADQVASRNSLGDAYNKLSDSNVYRAEDSVLANYNGVKYTAENSITGIDAKYANYPIEKINFEGETYLVILTQDLSLSKQRTIVAAYKYDITNKVAIKVDDTQLGKIKAKFPVFVQRDAADYINKYSNPSVKYYDSGSAKGMPAVVPVDINRGWYAGVQQVLSTSVGAQSSYQASGQVSSFWLCNVFTNNIEEFEKVGHGDDVCTQINLYTGQDLNVAGARDSADSRQLVSRAQQAITQANQQYSSGVKQVRIEGASYSVLNQVVVPSVRCQDYMSAKECLLLFNVCDPVICPTSRCNLGGQYYVSDVAASGIVGSALLCLPNVKEGIALPVCLTGISSGLDSYISVLKSHRDCLQEQLQTGKTVGICDQIYSIYMCEFFWREVTPIAKELLPKAVAGMYSGATRGGAEYIDVAGAWQNTQEATNYFTQTYAVNSMKAFQARSVEEAGGEFCKAFASIKAPTAFDSLIEPDSPPQFTAWFSSIKYTDATVPPTAQYKVYYHIFAGKDTSIQYQVYLKNPSTVSVVSVPQTLIISSGFITKGEYGTETRDFTAPEGYKELCVNINGNEECGFGQVTSSFAIDYLTDKSRAATINQTGVTTAAGCVSGEVGTSVSINPNLQATAESALNPAIYNQGIIRICATNNPGSTSSPDRYVQVGYCDTSNIGCWLDTESTARAISEGNNATREGLAQSLEQLQEANNEQLTTTGIIYDSNTFSKEYSNLKKSALAITGATLAEIRSEVTIVVNMINAVDEKLILSSQKAQVMALRGDTYSEAAGKILVLLGKKTSAGVATEDKNADLTAQAAANTVQSNGVSSTTAQSATQSDISLDDALIQVNSLSGSYSDNKAFVDGLMASKRISATEYNEINGEGLLNLEEDMVYVQKILAQKKATELKNRKGESGLITFKMAQSSMQGVGYYSDFGSASQLYLANVPMPVYAATYNQKLTLFVSVTSTNTPASVGRLDKADGVYAIVLDATSSESKFLGQDMYSLLQGQRASLASQAQAAPEKTYKFTGNVGFIVNGDIKSSNDLHVGDEISVQIPNDCDSVKVKLNKGNEAVKQEIIYSPQTTSTLGNLDAGDYTLNLECYQGSEVKQSTSAVFSVKTIAESAP